MTTSILKLALGILGGAFLLCLGGIIWLSAAEPARAIPDVLVAVTTGILGLFGGIMVPNRESLGRGERGAISPERALVIIILGLFVLFLLFAVLPRV